MASMGAGLADNGCLKIGGIISTVGGCTGCGTIICLLGHNKRGAID